MPTYTFKNSVTGKRKEFLLSFDEYKPVMIVKGEKWERDLAADLESAHIEDSESWNGMKSRALGIHPDDVPAFVAEGHKHGVNVNYDGKGNPVFGSRAQRKKYCKWRGAVDYEGGYGDNT